MMAALPVTIDYYYRVRWGYHDEFWQLFRRNHYPILAEQVRTGRLLGVPSLRPTLPRRRTGRLEPAGSHHLPRLGRRRGALRARNRGTPVPRPGALPGR
jgi:hypothetical protein